MTSGSRSPGRPINSAGSFQDALRVVGLGLETADVRRANLQIDERGVRVHTTTSYGVRTYTWEELGGQARTLQAQRRPNRAGSADPWSVARWSVLLRGAGALLDAEGIANCELAITVSPEGEPGGSTLRALVDGNETFTEVEVAEQLLRLRMRHDDKNYPSPTSQARQRRGWWPFRKGG